MTSSASTRYPIPPFFAPKPHGPTPSGPAASGPAARRVLSRRCALVVATLLVELLWISTAWSQSLDTPMTRLRPISQPSAVDSYISQAVRENAFETSHQVVTAQWESTAVETKVPHEARTDAAPHHAAMMQIQLPSGANVPTIAPPVTPADSNLIPPPSLGNSSPYGSPNFTPAPQNTSPPAPTTVTPRGLPMNPGFNSAPSVMTTGPGSRDLLPVAPPQLNDQFATIDNCSCISPASGYVAATGWTQCAPTSSYVAPAPSAYIAPASSVVAPLPIAGPPIIPDASTLPAGSGVPRHSLISFGQDRNPIVVGQGLIGQPVAYVPGQPVRNWIRYFFP